MRRIFNEIHLLGLLTAALLHQEIPKNLASNDDDNTENVESENAIIEETDAIIQRRDLTLAYILSTIDPSVKGMVRKVRCPGKASELLNTLFQTVSEASIDGKL